MKTTMRSDEKTAIKDAVAALQPFYDPGDDGYPVTLALDALAGVLGNKAGVDVEEEKGLAVLLAKLDAPDDLTSGVEKLYGNTAGGEYGAGLSKKQARTINDLVQEVVDPLVELITSYRRSRRPATRKKPLAKRRKR